MLSLERMELRGFKSFGDKTELRFRRGITAIVGPNGCGKSNIGDAINWVLGEQSAKMLRGRQMVDVIFNGSEGRKPVGLAEVTLVFGGAEDLAGADQGRLSVTRRLFRSGESEYRLNGARVRLMDIQEVLREGKVGARTYATIEQGRIEQVLSAKPKERRALIEDAAGISGYKHKRRLAELKLEATHANLLRVNDIVTEVQRQINSLKRQAAKARRYRRLRDELRAVEGLRFARQARDLDAEIEAKREQEGHAREQEAEAAAHLARLEEGLVEVRGRLDRTRRELQESSDRRHREEMEIDRAEARVGACRERIDDAGQTGTQKVSEIAELEQRRDEIVARRDQQQTAIAEARSELERLEGELEQRRAGQLRAEQTLQALREGMEQLRNRQFESMSHAAELRNQRRSAEEAMERTGARRARLESEHTEAGEEARRLAAEVENLERELSVQRETTQQLRERQTRGEQRMREAHERNASQIESLTEAREREKTALARLATLEDLETRFTGVSDGVKTLLGAGASAGIRTHGVVADYVEASRDVEGAAESYLRWLLPTVVLEDDDDARQAARYLRESGAGRTSLICRSQPAGALAVGGNGQTELPHELREHQGVIGRLRDRLTLKASINGAVADRIGDAVLVEDLDTALELHRRHPVADYLTRDGDVVFASGVIEAGGHRTGDHGLLAHRRRLESLQVETARASTAAAEHQRRAAEAREILERLEADSAERRASRDVAERRLVELEPRLEHARAELSRAERGQRVLADELSGLLAEVDPLHATLRAALAESQVTEESQRAVERSLVESRQRFEQEEVLLKRQIEDLAHLRAEVAARGQRRAALEQEAGQIAERLSELAGRLETLRREADEAAERGRAAEELLRATEEELEGRRALRDELVAREREQSGAVEQLEGGLGHDEGQLRDARGATEALREQSREVEMARARIEAARAHLDDLCRQELGFDAAEALAGAEPETLDVADSDQLDARLSEIREKIERIGPVNMTAIEEFGELEERDEFLTAQRADLERSMESLRESIRRINRQSRQRFADAFEAIRASYQEVYQLLFSGGRADLRLEQDDNGDVDVLEAGIEILAQPPGKRLSGVHLLSGGEKSLSAIALLFAIFRYQPSPFCLLDEVDAALDDANVGRFARMVGEYAQNTQFIIVTHNKLSMEAADLLYGVTMEEPGVSKIVSLQLQ